jgi:hypothetical protein
MEDAVDALDTSDFEELGVGDGGVELRGVVEEMVAARRALKQAGDGGAGAGAEEGPLRKGAAPLGESGRPVIRRAAWRRPAERGGEGGAGAGADAEKGK